MADAPQLALGAQPRQGKYADRTGAYEQAFRVVNPVIDPGEVLTIEQYFTGYGRIHGAKVTCFPSDDVFDSERSEIVSGLKKHGAGIGFGASTGQPSGTGNIIKLGGIRMDGWEENTQFVDLKEGDATPTLLTECKVGGLAPVVYRLRTRRRTKPGTYALEFYFVYYNGDAWHSSARKIEFKVRNLLERYQVVIGFIALFGTIVALARYIVLPLLGFVG